MENYEKKSFLMGMGMTLIIIGLMVTLLHFAYKSTQTELILNNLKEDQYVVE